MTNKKTSPGAKESYYGEFLEHYRVIYIRFLCRELRKKSTKSEDILWQALRNRRLAGMKFLRQHPFGRYIVDFYCHAKRLVVEVDDGIHNNPDVKEYDRERQKIIELYGVRFFRCTSEEVEQNLEQVLVNILKAAQGTHSLSPSHTKGGGAGGGEEFEEPPKQT